jgi:ankyrin repeat protein
MKKRFLAALFLVFAATQFGCASNGLSRAAIDGDLKEAKALVDKGEKVNDIDKWGWTPLMWSIYYGNIPITKLLLETGADPNLKSTQPYGNYLAGTSPLILAAAYGHEEAVAALLKKNADPDYLDKNKKKAIDYAREYQFEKCVALLQKQ